MKIESNVNGVLDRVRRMPRDIRAAMARTLAPAQWEKALADEAKRTLWALAKPNVGLASAEWSFVESFLQTLLVAPFMNGFLARLSNPLPPVLAIEDFMMARGLQTRALNTGSGPTLFSDFLNQFDQMMTDWVATEKRKDRRDWDKSDDDLILELAAAGCRYTLHESCGSDSRPFWQSQRDCGPRPRVGESASLPWVSGPTKSSTATRLWQFPFPGNG